MPKKHKYSSLYLDMIRYGISQAEKGTSYQELISHLKTRGYDLDNDCVELGARRWFYDSFHHMSADKDNPYTEYSHLCNHENCNFVMSGDITLKYLQYRNATISIGIASAAVTLSALYFVIANIVSK